MMPNTTYEIRKLYFEQSQYSAKEPEPYEPQLLQWPEKYSFKKFKPDAYLLQKALLSVDKSTYSVADQVFGNQKEQEHTSLQHAANLLHERAKLHEQHIGDIDHSHLKVQHELFGVKINNFPDRARRLSNLEGQLLQLESQRRDEELAFWKDTVDLRDKLFESAATYKAANHRYSIFSKVEGEYGG